MTASARNYGWEVARKQGMHFAYAFFCEDGERVYIRVGESTRPYGRLRDTVAISPFPVSEAVLCHLGDLAAARSFGARIRHALRDHSSRDGWYVFDRAQGRAFGAIVGTVYAQCTGRRLAWKRMKRTAHDMPERKDDHGDS